VFVNNVNYTLQELLATVDGALQDFHVLVPQDKLQQLLDRVDVRVLLAYLSAAAAAAAAVLRLATALAISGSAEVSAVPNYLTCAPGRRGARRVVILRWQSIGRCGTPL
jgi:hypothetical protein